MDIDEAEKPQRVRGSPKRVSEIAEAIAEFSGDAVTRDVIVKALKAHPRASEVRPEKIIANLTQLDDSLGLGRKRLVLMCCSAPSLFCARPSSVVARIDCFAAFFELDRAAFLHAARHFPQCLYLSVAETRKRIAEVASVMGLPEPAYRQTCLGHMGLIAFGADSIRNKIERLSGVFGCEQAVVSGIVAKVPGLLALDAERLGVVKVQLANALQWPVTGLEAVLRRYPKLLTQKPETLAGNVERVAKSLDLVNADVATAARRFPPLLYLDTHRLIGKLRQFGEITRIPYPDVANAFLRMPTLAGRDPLKLARRLHMCVRAASRLGAKIDCCDVLKSNPAVVTYSTERMFLRLITARLGLWGSGWSSLVQAKDERIVGLLMRHANAMSISDGRRKRILAIIERCVPNRKRVASYPPTPNTLWTH